MGQYNYLNYSEWRANTITHNAASDGPIQLHVLQQVMGQYNYIKAVVDCELYIYLGAQLCRLSPVDAHTVSLKSVMENI